jgi:PknH-like extracellular domain
MPAFVRPLLTWCVAALVASCTQTVDGLAVRSVPEIDEDSRSPIDVETLMLDQSQMRAITGAGEDLTIVPSMDGKFPVDIEQLMKSAPPQCEWIFAETQTFGPEVEEFHKTTFQNPPDGGLISQGVAGYRDAQTDELVGLVDGCDSTDYGPMFVGDWAVTADSLRTRPSQACGRDYRVKSVVLVEVTFCAFPASVPDLVMTNILEKIPG